MRLPQLMAFSLLVLNDGTDLSIQASEAHMCSPKNNIGPYTQVEVNVNREVKEWGALGNRVYPASGAQATSLAFGLPGEEATTFTYFNVPIEWVQELIARSPIDFIATFEQHAAFRAREFGLVQA